MKKHQHPEFLVESFRRAAEISEQIATLCREVCENPETQIGDQPDGSYGYRHIATLSDGTIVGLHRHEAKKQSEGLQLIIKRDGQEIAVPGQEPFIPWSIDDAAIPAAASEVARELVEALVRAETGATLSTV